MKEINNISDLKKDKIYYIDVNSNDGISFRPKMKLKGKFVGKSDKKYIFFENLEYINDHYSHLRFPCCKPIMLKLYKINGHLYRLISQSLTIEVEKNPELYKHCRIYEPENERLLVNFVMRNKIINDPCFDYYIDYTKIKNENKNKK